MERVAPVLLAIGTTHPLNIAGVGLDAKVASRLGVRLVSIVAGVSAQDAGSVLARMAVDPDTIAAQFAAVSTVPVAAVHIGALLDASSVRAVARGLPALAGVPIVCDPVIAATGGGRLTDDAAIATMRDELFAQCALMTPNLDEAGILLDRGIHDVGAMEIAARELLTTGAGAVLLKGGHLANAAIDVLAESAGGAHRFAAPRITATLRGTGDLLACAIAARLAHGDALVPAIDGARSFVRECLESAVIFAGASTLP